MRMHAHRIEPRKLHAKINMAAHSSTQIFSRIARLERALHKAARRNLLKWGEDFLLLSGIKIRCLTTWLRPILSRICRDRTSKINVRNFVRVPGGS